MAKLIFKSEDLKRVVEHSLAAPKQGQKVVGITKDCQFIKADVEAPAVTLVHDQGIYLMSNGTPGDPLDSAQDMTAKYFKHYVAYAEGCRPKVDENWYDNARDLVGGDDFAETLEWAEVIKRHIDAGYKTIIVNFSARRISLMPGKR